MEHRNCIVLNLPHHQKSELCVTRPPYRQGKNLTSIKVFTVSKESQHIMIYGVPAVGLDKELLSVCKKYGEVKRYNKVPSDSQNMEECPQFTDVFQVHYGKLKNARFAKKYLDNLSFYGGILHVCYSPELETVDETRAKLVQRRKDIARRTQDTNKFFNKGSRPPQKTNSSDSKLIAASSSQVLQESLKTFAYNSVHLVQESKLVEAGVQGMMFLPKKYSRSNNPVPTFKPQKRKAEETDNNVPISSTSTNSLIVKKFIPSSVSSRIVFFKK